ncbi:MAG: 6-carboxyhexanoate--CoA ligase [Nitrospirota bacterium]
MWNIRMRASKTVGSQKEIHISGAEGIYEDSEISKIVKKYAERALNHPRGKPDNIVITIEEIKQKPKKVQLLPVTTLRCKSPDEAKKTIFQTLSGIGVPTKAIKNSFKVLTSQKIMRGAALILEKSAIRMEPDRERGVRVSRLGIEKAAEKVLVKKLSKMRVDTTTVKEALILASKVASHPDVTAEICISDDPDYTTGYIASKQFGYLRIPNIRRHGEKHGGRVFIIKEDADIGKLIKYLEKTPVIVSGVRF